MDGIEIRIDPESILNSIPSIFSSYKSSYQPNLTSTKVTTSHSKKTIDHNSNHASRNPRNHRYLKALRVFQQRRWKRLDDKINGQDPRHQQQRNDFRQEGSPWESSTRRWRGRDDDYGSPAGSFEHPRRQGRHGQESDEGLARSALLPRETAGSHQTGEQPRMTCELNNDNDIDIDIRKKWGCADL